MESFRWNFFKNFKNFKKKSNELQLVQYFQLFSDFWNNRNFSRERYPLFDLLSQWALSTVALHTWEFFDTFKCRIEKASIDGRFVHCQHPRAQLFSSLSLPLPSSHLKRRWFMFLKALIPRRSAADYIDKGGRGWNFLIVLSSYTMKIFSFKLKF